MKKAVIDHSESLLEREVTGLGVFVGEFVHSLDIKKRFTIPSVWRAQAGTPKSLYILPDFYHKCLNVFPAGEMGRKLEKLRRQSMTDQKAMDFASVLGAASDLVPWDTQGRIRIKDKLLNFANIKDRVVLVGALDKFQLWTPEARPETGEIDQKALIEAGRYIDF
ncbi:division/cell wall cluster transcriptional repressor MraZ [Verrucomicrobiota bacterium]